MIVTTSWDDGSVHDEKIAALLAKYGLKGTFYVPFAAPHGVMRPTQLRDLAAHFEIGGHTMTHLNLTKAPARTAREEIAASKRRIEDTTGRGCDMFCFPKGHFRREHLAMLRDAGFLGARTVELLSLGFARPRSGIAVMPTTIQAFSHSWMAYARNAVKRHSAASLPALVTAFRQRNWTTIARSLFQRCLRQGGVFHLWGHSWEIEEQGAWGPLEELMAYLSEWRGRAIFLNNAEACQYAVFTRGNLPAAVMS